MLNLIINYGGGVNSLAILCGLYERGIKPAIIVFADTGGEKPETYESISRVDEWLASIDWPPVTRVTNAGRTIKRRDGTTVVYSSLEDECLKTETLPSRAYGFGRCADHWKRRPIERYLRKAVTGEYTQAIGYDAGETARVKHASNPRSTLWFPLIDWGWDRAACSAAIERQGLSIPAKSACFFCPSSKKSEILALPLDLRKRSLAIEDTARPGFGPTLHGLGRRFSWSTFLQADKQQQDAAPESIVESCLMCTDSEDT